MREEYQKVKENLTEEQLTFLLEKLGVSEFRDCGAYISIPSICHNEHEEDAKHNLVYYKDTKSFHCFSECSDVFDIFGLIERRKNLLGENFNRIDAYFYVTKHCGIGKDDSFSLEKTQEEDDILRKIRKEKQSLSIVLPEINPLVLETFIDKATPEWLSDGISIEAMKKYNIKYSISQNKIIIPHYDADNRLVGIRGRALEDSDIERYGKYGPIWLQEKMYNHPLGLNLYGLNIVRKQIKKTGLAIIVESEKACLQAESFLGEKNVVVSVCGSKLNRWQVLLLIQLCNPQEIIIAFDREEKDNSSDYYYKLHDLACQYKGYCNMSFIYDNKLLAPKTNPFDMGEEIFYKLLPRRIKV